jgi:hypothetical protein
MSEKEQQPAPGSRLSCILHIRGLSATRIILWLLAITIASFVIGFALLAVSGDLPLSSDTTHAPFRHTGLAPPNTTSIPSEGATGGDVKITLGAGDLTLQGDSPDNALMEATVFSTAAEWQPELVQTVNGSRKTVTLTEKGHRGKEWFAVDSPNSWEIRMNDRIPVRLDVNVGAGDSDLTLGSLNLETLAVHTGAGDTTVDLSGYHGGRFDAVVKNGVGDLTLRIPKESNTRILVHHGVGDVTGNGFTGNDGTFTTTRFNSSLAVNEITLNQGVGSIILEAV